MKDPVIKLVGKALVRFVKFREQNTRLFPPQITLYPIPFFGDIRRATTLTLALNPARTEFNHSRRWLPGLDDFALTTRLLHYFDLPMPQPHPWFGKYQSPLEAINCSFQTNTAHIDLCPLPTKFRNELSTEQQKYFGSLIENHSKSHLAGLLEVAAKAKTVLIIDYTFTQANGDSTDTSSFIRSNQPILELLQANNRRLKVLGHGGFVDL